MATLEVEIFYFYVSMFELRRTSKNAVTSRGE